MEQTKSTESTLIKMKVDDVFKCLIMNKGVCTPGENPSLNCMTRIQNT